MPLPAEFSSVEHLQSVFRQWMNREVLDYFQDLGIDDLDDDITTSRGSLRTACRHLDSDSMLTTMIRFSLFERIRKQKIEFPWIGIPLLEYDQGRKYKPQIVLMFQEDLGDIEPGYAPVTGRISFRAMGYESNTFTPSVAQTFANKISTEFAIGGGFVWRKGREMWTYQDWSKGYALQVLARDEAAARSVIGKVLDLQNDTIDEAILQMNKRENEAAAFPIVPGNDYIYGETRRLPRQRPLADCRFVYAIAHIHGLKNAIPLVDRTGLYPSALIAS